MKRYHNYHWHYAVILTMAMALLGCWLDILPQYRHIDELRHLVSDYESKLADQHVNAVTEVVPPLARANVGKHFARPAQLNGLVSAARASGLVIQSMTLRDRIAIHSIDVDTLHVILEGSFNQVVAFLYQIMSAKTLGWIADFSYQASSPSRFVLSMDMMLWDVFPVSISGHVDMPDELSERVPMCVDASALLPPDTSGLLSETPLNHIRMSGFVRHQDRVIAILTLPEGGAVSVSIGEHVGSERAVVKRITPSNIALQQGKKTWVIQGGRR